jgi:hypothetical protein
MPFLNRFSNRLLLIPNYDHKIPLIYWIGISPTIIGVSAISNSGNMYIGGKNVDDDAEITKYNSSGVMEWQKNLGGATTDAFNAIAVDSNDNIYTCGSVFNSLSNIRRILVVKYNSSGGVEWQKVIGGSVGNPDSGSSIAVDSSGNVYVLGSTSDNSITGPLIAKYNTSGTIVWRRRLNTNAGSASGIVLDSSGNFYISYLARPTTGTSSNDIGIAKYDTNGTIVWQRRIGNTLDERPSAITVDNEGKIYVLGYNVSSFGSPSIDALIFKYETDGSVLWQRSLGGTSGEDGTSIVTDINGDIYICVNKVNTLFAKLPKDGTLTGTYDVNGYSVVYANTTFTNFTTSFSSSNSTILNSSIALTITDAGLISTDGSETSYVTTIP